MSPQVFLPSFRALTTLVIQNALSMSSSTSEGAPKAPNCTASTFSALPWGNEIQIQSLDAIAHTGLAVPSGPSLGLPPTTRDQISSVEICLLTINYTHPYEGDTVTTWVGLPLDPSSWNGRFLMNGGGGWLAGDQARVVSAVGSGYASASTNAGHNGTIYDMPTWGLRSLGSVDWPALEDFASRAIVEAVRFGKTATNLYFGAKPKYLYWNGCSTGGRQGHGNKYPSIWGFFSLPFPSYCDRGERGGLLMQKQLSLRKYRASSVGSSRVLQLSAGPSFLSRRPGAMLLPPSMVRVTSWS